MTGVVIGFVTLRVLDPALRADDLAQRPHDIVLDVVSTPSFRGRS